MRAGRVLPTHPAQSRNWFNTAWRRTKSIKRRSGSDPSHPDTGLDLRRSEPPLCRRRNAGPGLPREYRPEHPSSSDKHAFGRRLLPTRATRDQLGPIAGLLFSLTVH